MHKNGARQFESFDGCIYGRVLAHGIDVVRGLVGNFGREGTNLIEVPLLQLKSAAIWETGAIQSLCQARA